MSPPGCPGEDETCFKFLSNSNVCAILHCIWIMCVCGEMYNIYKSCKSFLLYVVVGILAIRFSSRRLSPPGGSETLRSAACWRRGRWDPTVVSGVGVVVSRFAAFVELVDEPVNCDLMELLALVDVASGVMLCRLLCLAGCRFH